MVPRYSSDQDLPLLQVSSTAAQEVTFAQEMVMNEDGNQITLRHHYQTLTENEVEISVSMINPLIQHALYDNVDNYLNEMRNKTP